MAVSNAILLGENLISSVDATIETGDYVAENLLNSQPSELWRGVGSSNHVLRGSLTRNGLVSGIALGRHNLTSGSIRLELTTNDFDSTTFDQTWQAKQPQYKWGTGTWGNTFSTFGGYSLGDTGIGEHFIKTFTSVTANEYRITLSGLTASYPEAGVLYLGKAFQPVKNIGREPSIPVIDASSIEMTRGQSMRSDNQSTYREITVNYPILTPDEAHELRRIIRFTGMRGLMVFSLLPGKDDTDELETKIICRMVGLPDIRRRPDTIIPTYYTSPITFREAL